ncbi:DegV family protein [bacterium]|nr:DegV family protein [bacterium]
MQKKIGVKTSQANMNQMITAAAEMTKKYDQVIVLPIHRGLSGNANS